MKNKLNVGRVSWDVFIMRLPPELGDFPEDGDPPSLGSGRDVRAVLTAESARSASGPGSAVCGFPLTP